MFSCGGIPLGTGGETIGVPCLFRGGYVRFMPLVFRFPVSSWEGKKQGVATNGNALLGMALLGGGYLAALSMYRPLEVVTSSK